MKAVPPGRPDRDGGREGRLQDRGTRPDECPPPLSDCEPPASVSTSTSASPNPIPDQILTPAQRIAAASAIPDLEVKLAAALADVEQGISMRQAAANHGLPHWQVQRLVRQWDTVDYEGTVRNLLKAQGLGAVQAWAQAMHEAAAKGKHEPARDLLTHAGIIDPVEGQQGTGRTNIAIVIGTPDQPVSLQSLQVVDSKGSDKAKD